MASVRKITTPRITQAGAGALWRNFLLLGAAAGVIAWQAFDYGRVRGDYSAGRRGNSIDRLTETVVALEKERDDLRQKLAVLERTQQVDAEATRLAMRELADLQQEKEELEKDVELLRNLIKEDAAGALRIKDFTLTATAEARRYTYRFIVAQMREDFGVSKGRIHISVSGVFDGYAKTLSMQELGGDEPDGINMRFRHFQDIEGVLLLPEGLTPHSISVEIDPISKKLAPLSEIFDWNVSA
jgi:hypothetical protein